MCVCVCVCVCGGCFHPPPTPSVSGVCERPVQLCADDQTNKQKTRVVPIFFPFCSLLLMIDFYVI